MGLAPFFFGLGEERLTSPPAAEINPSVVRLARALLTLTGVVSLSLCAGLYISGVEIISWAWILTFCLGILSLLSAYFESPTGVVTTVIIFFHPD
jgi:hypothetical protein